MNESEKKINLLREYFEKEESVILAFIFGSKVKGVQRLFSDWDIAVYFKPYQYLELETEKEYIQEHRIWADLEKILGSNNIDFLVLNRASSHLVFSILNSGIPLLIKDRKLYLRLLIKTHYEAVDYWHFTKEYFEIAERTKSISEEDKAILRQHIIFLENEFRDIKKFEKYTLQDYIYDSDKRRNIERWVENLVMSAIDITKIILASEKREIPQTYRETLLNFALRFMDEDTAKRFSQFAEMRNIIVHEYMDIKWKRIKNFIEDASKFYLTFIEKIKEFV
ncbi:MAG: type VII toxin-antitoxin system HepT family RNase toxin [Thermodesulfovibrionales bacterium]